MIFIYFKFHKKVMKTFLNKVFSIFNKVTL